MVLESLAHLPTVGRRVLRSIYSADDPALRSRVFGIDFPNPVGLAAGFDKGGIAFNGLGALGFGFVEIGTVTAVGQGGNARPRLFRLPDDRALLNRMGFNNPGAEGVARTLRGAPIEVILGINVGKSKVTALEEAANDYLQSVELLERFAHYLVINVSSPNTPGLRELQEAGRLRELLAILAARRPGPSPKKPLLLKVAPDLTDSQLDQVVEIAMEGGVAGLIAVNTTIDRSGLRTPRERLLALGDGGISGGPVRARANEIVRRIHRTSEGRLPVIGVGGIFDADDAWERIRSGASLVQIYTGFVYEGPGVISRINAGLSRRLTEMGMASITEAIGTSV
jgi:dihydroorotate dehydrogenase